MYNSNIISSWLNRRKQQPNLSRHLPRLLLTHSQQPRLVKQCPVTQSIICNLQLLDWESLPITLSSQRTGWKTVPIAAYIGAYLVKLDQSLPTIGKLRRFLCQHPALVWALGFPLAPDSTSKYGFDVEMSLPSQRHFSRKLSELPNEILQNLLDSQVHWLQQKFGHSFGQVVAIDTKHILAWVKENNPKAYITDVTQT